MFSQSHDQVFEVFYDGACPICRREIAWLRSVDRENRICFTDISNPNFVASQIGKTHQQLMSEIHGRFPDGSLISGVEVFRQLYSAVGFTRWVAISRWLGVRQLLEVGYWCFARIRTKLPRSRCSDETCDLPFLRFFDQSPNDNL